MRGTYDIAWNADEHTLVVICRWPDGRETQYSKTPDGPPGPAVRALFESLVAAGLLPADQAELRLAEARAAFVVNGVPWETEG